MCSFEKFVKFCGFMSILRNSLWIAFLMILWSLLNPQYTYSMFYRIGLKFIEFYILWSTYASVKIFEGLRKVSKFMSGNISFSLCSSTFKSFRLRSQWWNFFLFLFSPFTEETIKIIPFPVRLHSIGTYRFYSTFHIHSSIFILSKRVGIHCGLWMLTSHKFNISCVNKSHQFTFSTRLDGSA